MLSRNLGRVVSLTVIPQPVFRSLACGANIKAFGDFTASHIGHHKIPVFEHERRKLDDVENPSEVPNGLGSDGNVVFGGGR